MTITIHTTSLWIFLGKLAVAGLLGWWLFCFAMLATMDSGAWWIWVIFVALMGALVYGLWFA